VAQTGNRHVAAGDQGYTADASALSGGQVSVSLTINGGGSATGSGNGSLVITDKSGNVLTTQTISSNGAVQFSPSGTPLVFTLPQAYQGAVNFKVTDAAGNVGTASWPSVAVDVVPPPAPTVVTTDPGDGGYTHVLNARHSDLNFSFTVQPDDGISGLPLTVEYGYLANNLIDGGAPSEADYGNTNVTTKITLGSAAPGTIETAQAKSVPPLNTYYFMPREIDGVGNVSGLVPYPLDVNWSEEAIAYPGSDSTAEFGVWVSTGDIDGDGKADLAVLANGSSAWSVTVYYGGSFPLTRTQSFGGQASHFGNSVALGDVNGDGKADLIVINNDHIDVYLSNGSQLPSSPSFSITGDSSLTAVAVLGDFNGDGIADLVAADGTNGGGVVYVFFGRQSWSAFGGSIGAADVKISESNGSAFLGFLPQAIGALPDIDGDGRPELALGLPGIDTAAIVKSSGLSSGKSGDLSTYNPIIVTGTTGTFFGASVGAVDGNGDGLSDLVIGDFATPNSNIWLATQKAPGQFNGPTLFASGPTNFGAMIQAGDVNEDGQLDLLGGTNGAKPSFIRLFASHPTSGLSPLAFGQANGTNGFGETIAVGDVDGDGHLDVVIGQPYTANGTVYVLH
jgi:hypothetical protein